MSTLDCKHEIIESIENNPFLQDSEEISSFAGSGAGPTRDTDALPAPDAGMSPVPTLEHPQADDPASLTSHETPGESRADRWEERRGGARGGQSVWISGVAGALKNKTN